VLLVKLNYKHSNSNNIQPSDRLGAPNMLIKPHRNKGSGEESPVELTPTPEEQLLGVLLEANEALTSVLRVYHDLERIGVEHEAMERRRQEVRLDRSVGFVPFLCSHSD
jgi:hypothetical protein